MKVKFYAPQEVNVDELEDPISVSLEELGAVPAYQVNEEDRVFLPYEGEVEVSSIILLNNKVHFIREITQENIQKILDHERISGYYELYYKPLNADEEQNIENILQEFLYIPSVIGLYKKGFMKVSEPSGNGMYIIMTLKVAG